MAVLDEIAGGLDVAGIDARIGSLTSDEYPWPDQWRNDGFCAAMTMTGEPYWHAPNDPGERRLTQRMWDADPKARAAVIEHAVHWCDVEGGHLWLAAGVSAFKIPKEHAISLLTRSLDANPACAIIAARDSALVRRVGFDRNGYVIYELGGTKKPEWRECIDDLTSVLVDLHPVVEWGFVLRRPAGASGIGARTSRIVHQALWDPYEDEVAYFGRVQDPRRYPGLVLDVYGVQILGPGHDIQALGGEWEIRDLSRGRKLVSTTDLAAWFADAPSLEIMLAARESFGPLVDPIWNPQTKD